MPVSIWRPASVRLAYVLGAAWSWRHWLRHLMHRSLFLAQRDLPRADLLLGGMPLHLGYVVGPRWLLLYTFRYALPYITVILQTPWLVCVATCC